jgi:hypothetical protein
MLAHALGVAEAVLVLVVTSFAVAGDQGLSGLGFAAMLGVTGAVGWLLASRLPRNPLGWLLLFVTGTFLVSFPAAAVGDVLVETRPGVAAWLLWFGGSNDFSWLWLPPLGVLFTQVLLRFPDGRLPSPRWRWFSRLTVFVIAVGTISLATSPSDLAPGLPNPLGLQWLAGNTWLFPTIGIPLLLCFAGSAASVVVRYRHADTVTRAQIRWFAWAATTVVGLFVFSFALPASSTLDNVVSTSYGLIPASIGVAVLRYRLYDIDRVVSRTLAYGLVTAGVLAVYATMVAIIGRLVPSSSSFAVATATLTAAAAFRPLLSRVQAVVDHRFNRARYDAQRLVDVFALRLRDTVDPDATTAALLTTVDRSLQPASLGLWVND